MLRTNFKKWIELNKNFFEELSITTEYVKHNKKDESLIPDPSTGVIHESDKCLGQVSVWESRQMEYEVVNIETEELILWKYIERLPDDPNFNEILTEYFNVLKTGIKQ